MQCAVGQILYVVLSKETRVVPIQVVEEITKKTINGVETSYVVMTGPSENSKRIMLSDVKGEVFTSAERAKQVLIERVKQNIVKLVDHAVDKALEWYPNSFERSDEHVLTQSQTIEQRQFTDNSSEQLKREMLTEAIAADESSIMTTLPDGTTARVRLPQTLV